MPGIRTTARLWLAALVLLVAFAPARAGAPAPAAATPHVIRDFAPTGDRSGWLMLDNRLWLTADDGATWRNITPAAATEIMAAAFLSPDQGWVVSAQTHPAGTIAYTLLATDNGGGTWRETALPLFALGNPDAIPAALTLQRTDADSAVLVIRRATSSAFDLRTAFETRDGGRTWARLSSPPSTPPAASAHGQTVRGLNERIVWAVESDGECTGEELRQCTAHAELSASADGGTHWRSIMLPTGERRLRVETQVFRGQGFDKCEVASVAQAQTWWSQGPYRTMNLYIGGAARGCGNTGLGRDRVIALAQQGWAFIPTWVGPQAPCTSFAARFSSDANAAREQGRAEADLALARARELGLGDAISQTVVYYDLEYFPLSDAGCVSAARAFVDGWSGRLRALGQKPGLYATACTMPSMVNVQNVPEAIWAAHWIRDGYDPAVTVWDLACLGNDVWSNSQRLRQYTGGQNETWGGTTMHVGSNVLDGPVAYAIGLSPTPTATPTRTPTVTPTATAEPTRTPLPPAWRALYLPLIERSDR